MKKPSPKLVLMGLILIGFGLRLLRLNFQPLWGDEGWSFYFATMPLVNMIAKTAVDIHPPFYYFLLHLWLGVAGTGASAARFLSIIAGTLLIPTGYLLGQLLSVTIGNPHEKNLALSHLGLINAGIITIAPMAIYYSQEVRMYGLVSLLGLLSTVCFIYLLQGRRHFFWPYVVTLTLALYTMYYGGFIGLFHGLYWLYRYRNLKRETKSRIAKAFVVSAVLYLPWVIFAGQSLAEYIAQKADVEGYTSLPFFRFFWYYFTAFSLGHPSAVWESYQVVSGGFILITLFGLVFVLRQKRAAGLFLLAYLLIPLLLGWIVNLFNPFTPRFFERTLLIAAPAWWMILGLGLVWLWQQRHSIGLVASGLLLSITFISLIDFYQQPRYTEADYRPLLAKVAAIAQPNDVLLASYQWQLGYYQAYLPQTRPQLVIVPAWGQEWGKNSERMAADLAALLSKTVWFPAHQTLGRSWETEAEAMMADIGFPTLLQWYGEDTKLSVIESQIDLQLGPSFNFANQLQAQLNLPPKTSYESSRGIIPLEIEWTKLSQFDDDYRVTLKLVDTAGEVWASRDSLPQAAQASFTTLAIDETLSDRHGLLITPGTPPGQYTLRLSVTNSVNETPLDLFDATNQPQGVEALLLPITVIPSTTPLSPKALARQTVTDWNFENQLKLVGYSLSQTTVSNGDILPVNLFWQGLNDHLADLTIFVQLQDTQGQAVALTERVPVYRTTHWSKKTLLRDLHKLKLPATIPAGTYRLAAGVLLADKQRLHTQSGDQVILGEIIVETRLPVFDPPNPQVTLNANFSNKATLIGYDLGFAQDHKAGDSVILTLYWRSDAGFNRSWTVFAHIVDNDGRIWGQQDQQPGAGKFPTTSWIPGEFIADTHQIFLNPAMPTGTYTLRVGLYDALSLTFERIPVAGGDTIVLETLLPISKAN